MIYKEKSQTKSKKTYYHHLGVTYTLYLKNIYITFNNSTDRLLKGGRKNCHTAKIVKIIKSERKHSNKIICDVIQH